MSMEISSSVRRGHRTLAYIFTALVFTNVISALIGGPEWIGYLAIAPLVIMMFSGWYLLWLPHSRGKKVRR